MKIAYRDPEILAALRPGDVEAYLASSGWKQVDKIDTRAHVWMKHDAGRLIGELLVSLRPEWRDYPLRVSEVVQGLADVEQRSPMQVLEDIGRVGVDAIKIRIDHPTAIDGSIPWTIGTETVQGVTDMMSAAAASAVEPKPVFAGRRPGLVSGYMANLRMGQSERGSYVINVLSPVRPSIVSFEDARQLPLIPDLPAITPTYERAVTTTLSNALRALASAIKEAINSDRTDPFDTAVSAGVSANLCEALVEIGGDSSPGVDVGIRWSPTLPHGSGGPVTQRFTRPALAVLRDAARALRERHPVDHFELTGFVTLAARPDSAMAGKIAVDTFIDRRPRKVVVDLFGDDWQIAHKAIGDRLAIRCTGQLAREGRLYVLRNPQGVQVLSEGEKIGE